MSQALNESRVLTVRGQPAVIDSDLAQFYGVRTTDLNRGVARNKDRFPNDFRFQLTQQEWQALRGKNSPANISSRGGRTSLPWVYTELGALQTANVIKSERASAVSVSLIRAFTKMRHQLNDLGELPALVEKLSDQVAVIEENMETHDDEFADVHAQLAQLTAVARATTKTLTALSKAQNQPPALGKG